MRWAQVDERDSSWENDEPRFRVYFFTGGDRPYHSWTVDTYEVTDADVLAVVEWAQRHSGDDGLYAVALVGEDGSRPEGQRRGLTWLVGIDANINTDVADEDELRALAAMTARRGRRLVDLGQLG